MRDLTKAEPHQPKARGKGKYTVDIGLREYYKYYRNSSKFKRFISKFGVEKSDRLRVSQEKFSEIFTDYLKECNKKLLNNEPVRLPCNFGEIRIVKIKARYHNKDGKIILPVNWAETKRLGKKVYFTNDNRENYVYRYKWFKRGLHKSVRWYKFIPTRTNKRSLKQYLTDKSNDFSEHINKIFTKQ